ncbi:MAG: chemotaxis-specific protein-glutamate methyltransferase CheB [Prolixibacteraceae bacterium]|jgi:two-component system, chemotaxis family, protein-glutamate methylesterase/glutaminase|nr:chemotaxis-specific protein-glutamate methyltransferase CheB [Prolixibacteraceae bacterium]MBT6763895.1 chemotaxis-specific protein-glutamate methyltransferase CheB [Prolixibacteraceae bacterium]MBT6999604.1 chemotaxis-specific protein-glutamate methyltransferase CheB [Prolixibacteraceae bacterium]MBT7393828.1 chemotaxis-specific protein-glutamate methyltransferase CheB [Prolixibacteraceae bacterium]
MIKVLIVEDSRVMQELLIHIINSDPALNVVGKAVNGKDAIDAVKKLRPDIITMDINMPKMDGFEATRHIMETIPTPIIIVSGNAKAREVAYSFKMLQAGALAVLLRPPGLRYPDHKAEAGKLIETLKLMSEIKVIKRNGRNLKKPAHPSFSLHAKQDFSSQSKLIAIGVSTGGPPLLQKIISGLPKNFPVPLLIVQHLSPGFLDGFAEWLALACNFPIHIAKHNEYPLPGHAYLAPDGFHMGLGNNFRIILSNHAPENGLRPSVSYLFQSIAQNFGSSATGIILTGMGKDGANELKQMKDKGAITIAQDKESSVVHGMPGEAIKLNAATHIFSPDGIIKYLSAFVKEE